MVRIPVLNGMHCGKSEGPQGRHAPIIVHSIALISLASAWPALSEVKHSTYKLVLEEAIPPWPGRRGLPTVTSYTRCNKPVPTLQSSPFLSHDTMSDSSQACTAQSHPPLHPDPTPLQDFGEPVSEQISVKPPIHTARLLEGSRGSRPTPRLIRPAWLSGRACH